MLFFTAALSFVISISMIPLFTDLLPCRDIIDIYYKKELESTAYDSKCKFTKTEIYCKDCGNFYISRKHYKRWAKEYEKNNFEPAPFPKRTDKNNLFEPIKLKN